MRTWAPVLHFYQPPTQAPGLTDWIRHTCYNPLLDVLLETKSQLTVNISGSLLLQLESLKATEIFDKLHRLLETNQLEVLSTPAYHPLIPLTPVSSVERQIAENDVIHERLLGQKPSTVGFFPPELAIDQKTLETLKNKYEFLLIDESSINPEFNLDRILSNSLFDLNGQKLAPISRSVSEIIRSYPGRLTAEKFIAFFEKMVPENATVFSLSDAEVFGHHYEFRLNLLKDALQNPGISIQKLSTAAQKLTPKTIREASITTSSWQTTSLDLQKNNPFPLWADTKNSLHDQYWFLVEIAQKALGSLANSEDESLCYIARHHFDRGVSSCHPFWLSRNPWWHPDLAEAGATELIKTVRTCPASRELKQSAEEKFHHLLMTIWQFHWSGETQSYFDRYDKQREELLRGLPKID